MEENILGLYNHNIEASKKIKEAYKTESIVGIVHATGTGKSYIALNLAYENRNKKIIYVVPSRSIIEHLNEIIKENNKSNYNFENIEFRTYQSFVNMTREDLKNLDVDMLIVDEFQYLGTPVWGARINEIIKTHKNLKIFGMTAYTVRDRKTPYERDMIGENELFSNKIVSRYDLCDAIIDGVLPKPNYKSVYTKILDLVNDLEIKIENKKQHKNYQEYKKILEDVKKRVFSCKDIYDLIQKNIKPNGKYIYFCPPHSENGINDLDTIMEEAYNWFKRYVKNEDIIFYKSTSEMGDLGYKNRKAFYNDETIEGENAKGKLRVMFAINQYNLGVHAKGIDGVIMGRGTNSDIVFFEQLGRALSVRGNLEEKIKEYEKYSKDELLNLCLKRDIEIDENLEKEEIIEKLIAPVVIDLTNNFDYIKELENNLKNRIKEYEKNKKGNRRKIKIKNYSFDITIENKNLFEMLNYLRDRLGMTWEDNYELALNYYNFYKNLEVPQNFKTLNGYEYNDSGISLESWLKKQRDLYKNNSLEAEKIKLLEDIGFIFDIRKEKWDKNYELALNYYNHYKNLEVPQNFKTLNGYEYNDSGIQLGTWIFTQRANYKENKLEEEKIKLLEQIGMRFKTTYNIDRWNKNYELALKYYNHYGNLEIPRSFKTLNGYEYNDSGALLGDWISNQRVNYRKNKLEKGKVKLLEQIGMVFEPTYNIDRWKKNYELSLNYYNHYKNLEIPQNFKTLNGYEYNDSGVLLGNWISNQRSFYQNGKLEEEKIKLLEQIGMRFKTTYNIDRWRKNYELALNYYNHYKNLEIPKSFKTLNGYEYNDSGIQLGTWISNQRKDYKENKLEEEKVKFLEQIGMRFKTTYNIDKWKKNYELALNYYNHYKNLEIPQNFKTLNGYEYDDSGVLLGSWISRQRTFYQNGKLEEEKVKLLEQIGMRFNPTHNIDKWNKNYELALNYYNHYGNLEIPRSFKTLNGYEYDDSGVLLGNWIYTQTRDYKNNKLEEEKVKLLEQIGMRFKTTYNIDKWKKNYELALNYYNHYGNLKIPRDFKTINGYEYNDSGVLLGNWISNQRAFYQNGRLEEEKIRLLEQIGIVWNTRKNKQKLNDIIKIICEKYNLDYNENKKLFEHISLEKLKYFIDNFDLKDKMDLNELINFNTSEKKQKK